MEKVELETLIAANLTIREIAKHCSVSGSTIRHWLKVHQLKTKFHKHRRKRNPNQAFRCKCGETDPEKFYGNKISACADCHNRNVLELGREKKARARALLGGKCALCGFDRYQCALDFHHTDPAEKDVSFKSMRCWSWERIECEIRKCVLLCKNCHAGVHAGLVEISNLGMGKFGNPPALGAGERRFKSDYPDSVKDFVRKSE